MECLQFHRLHHILSISKPQNQFIAFLHAFGGKANPMIQIGQLIGPLFPVIPFFELLQYRNPLFKPHILRFIQLILQNVLPAVIGRDLLKLLIILNGRNHFAHFYRKVTQRINDHSSGRMPLICHFQQKLRILKPPVDLIYIADCAEHHHALYPGPVYGVRHLRCFYVFFLGNQRLDFLCAYFIFIFIQGCHLYRNCMLKSRSGPVFTSFKFTIATVSCQSDSGAANG